MEIDLRGNRTAVTPKSSMSPIIRPFLIPGKHRSMQLCRGRNLTLLAAQGLLALGLVTLHVAGVVDQGIPGRTVVGVAGCRS